MQGYKICIFLDTWTHLFINNNDAMAGIVVICAAIFDSFLLSFLLDTSGQKKIWYTNGRNLNLARRHDFSRR